ncbi:unnamed protein product [Ilex paraguariensis]|uniref:C2 domain-containing protein n=1 Tax=Ilex paraguariensis TaxID=185542 RepID=A0ABC8QP42_9AQUA
MVNIASLSLSFLFFFLKTKPSIVSLSRPFLFFFFHITKPNIHNYNKRAINKFHANTRFNACIYIRPRTCPLCHSIFFVMETKARNLEITVISGEGLRIKQRRVKQNAFVILRTDSHNVRTTNSDAEGGSYPAWHEKLVVDMPMHARYVTVEVHCKTCSGNKIVGMARIPASDFLGGYVPANYLHFLSYRLRDVKGERNGIINLSVRVKSPANGGCGGGSSSGGRPLFGAPIGQKVSNSNGIAVGVPVWYQYQV